MTGFIFIQKLKFNIQLYTDQWLKGDGDWTGRNSCLVKKRGVTTLSEMHHLQN